MSDSKTTWFFHINACYRKGYTAGTYEKAGQGETPNPYQQAAGSARTGVQMQRRAAWERGRQRALKGLPLNDQHG